MQLTAPPDVAFFERPLAAFGPRALAVVLGDVAVELTGIDEALEERLGVRFATHRGAVPRGATALAVAVRDDAGHEHYIDPPARPQPNPVLLAFDAARVRFVGHRAAGWFDAAGGAGRLLLGRGDYEPPERAIENFVRVAVAWLAATRGGALVHAASAVHRGRGYLFYGPSGAGKSTLSACNRRATVVSDDLSLVLPDRDGRLELIGTPFRGTYEEGRAVRGRFPLAAGFRLLKDVRAEVRPAPRVRALAELVGNLPFVAEAFRERPDLFDAIERAFAPIPLAHLHFTKDDGYWDAIDRAGL